MISNLNRVKAIKSSLVISCVNMEFAANVLYSLGVQLLTFGILTSGHFINLISP
jgi:hypothetical protein